MTTVLFGKKEDPNINLLLPFYDGFIDQESDLEWDLESDKLSVNGVETIFSHYFGRSNVFGKVSNLMMANYYLMKNYLIAHPEISRHNHKYEQETPTKASNLLLAKKTGLKIPRTVIGTSIDETDAIIKPLTGGFHTSPGSKAIFTAILQQRIIGVNRRLFVVGKQSFGFDIHSTKLDYRDDPNVSITASVFDDATIDKAHQLAELLGLTYAALDFVGDYFLEINTLPMFAAFDPLTNGNLAKSIRHSLD